MTELEDQMVANTTRTLQIIVGAMVAGLEGFLLTVVFLVQSGRAQSQLGAWAHPVITYLALIFGTAMIIGSVVVPRIIAANGRRRLIEGKRIAPAPGSLTSTSEDKFLGELLPIFQSQVIVGVAMLEGSGMLAIVAFLREHRPIALSLAVVMVLGVASRIPTRARLRQWLEAQSELILLERPFAER